MLGRCMIFTSQVGAAWRSLCSAEFEKLWSAFAVLPCLGSMTTPERLHAWLTSPGFSSISMAVQAELQTIFPYI